MYDYKTLLEGIKNAAALYPENQALVFQDKFYTYQELIKEAEKWAFLLLKNAKKERLQRVAIFSYRNPTSYIATVAALLSGAAFIPLNPRFPLERNIEILKQSNPDAIIVDSSSVKELVNLSERISLPENILFPDYSIEKHEDIKLSFIKNEEVTLVSSTSFPNIEPNDVAYILFTSGSTGQPKGVPITHTNVCSFLKYNQSRYQIMPVDRFSQTFEQTFDLSVFDLFMAWCHGASLHAMRPIDLLSPSKYINQHKITIWFSVPSIIALMDKQKFLSKDIFPSLRLSLFCGEPLLEKQILAWAEAAPNSICENLYGPTELTIACSTYRWERGKHNISHNGIVAIGTLYDDLHYILLNEDGNVASDEGELCVAGNQRFAGYLNGNQEIKPYFINALDNNGDDQVYYRTGDKVRIDASGNILYLGRIDHQVKINGYRVELGEIESILTKISGVERALAFYLNIDDEQNKKLVSYVVGSTSAEDILHEAKKILPTYMIPSCIKVESSLPLNSNGKVDRKFIASQFVTSNA